MRSSKKRDEREVDFKQDEDFENHGGEKLSPRIEILDKIINLLPKRILKNERMFDADKEALENLASQESILDANLQRLQPVKMEEFKFPGESVFQGEKDGGLKIDKMLDRIITYPPNIDQTNILKMKYNPSLPYELQREFNIHYKENTQSSQIDQPQKSPSSGLISPNILTIRSIPGSEYLYSLACQERLRRFSVKSTNEYYLYTDILPTTNDIDKRAEILAKLFCKYNLQEEMKKAKEKREEESRIKQIQQMQIIIIQKSLSGNVVTKEDIEEARQKTLMKKKDKLSSSQQIEALRDTKDKKKMYSQQSQPQTEGLNKTDLEGNPHGRIDEEEGEDEPGDDRFSEVDEDDKDQEEGRVSDRKRKQRRQQVDKNIFDDGSQVRYNKEFEIQINEHRAAIEAYYKDKLIKLYERGLNDRFIKCKQEFELRKLDIQNINHPEVLLRHLIQIRLLKNIF